MTRQATSNWTKAVGLVLFFVLPTLLFTAKLIVSSFGRNPWLTEGLFWGLLAALFLYVRFVEREPLSSMGFARPTWQTLLYAIAFAIILRVVAAVSAMAVVKFTHGEVPGMATIMALGHLPIWMLVMLSVRAGIAEEILYRGYPIERIATLTGSRTLAGAVSLAAFTIAHLGAWSVAYMVIVSSAGLVLTVQYLWRRDLISNMLTHFITDAFGMAGAYAIAHHLVKVNLS